MRSALLIAVAVLALVALVDARAFVPEWVPKDVNATFAPMTTCGGNCPSGDCGSCPCGSSKSYVNIDDICAKYGWDQKCCQCIVSHESGGNANAANENTNGSFDVGVFQVNSFNWNACSGGKPPCDVTTNLDCAIDVYKWGGNTFKLWSTCGGCGCC